jgi:two-component system phosphate regulon sensor histidine kinase PhoR
MKLSFRGKLLASHVGLVVAVGVIALYTLDRWLTADLVRQLDQKLEEQAKGAIEWASESNRRHPEKVATRIAHIVDAEVTLFDADGKVLGASSKEAESDIGAEVKVAREGGVGRASRMRGGQEYHYVAVAGQEQIVVRLAVPLSEVNETVAAMRRRLLFSSTLAVLAAIVLGILASRVASRAVAERDHLSAILTGMAEGVLVIGSDGTILIANPAVEKILESKGSVAGKSIRDVVVDGELRDLVEACLRGEATETEIEFVDRRGVSIAAYVRPLPARAEVVAVLRDMTHLRKLMTIRRDFVANVSHELRTPVTSIQGYAETLLRGGTDAETTKQFLEIVHRQAQRIGALVEQLLALSELEARGKDDIAREPVAVREIAQHVAETMKGRADARHVTIAIDAAADVQAVADREGLERALLNLVDNAIKYGKEGGEVRVRAKRVNGATIVTVADDGPGVDPKHLPRLFERFYRVDPGRSRQHGGAGLGLSIVKHLVESMDGTIAVESDVGKGTSFVVTLPSK